MRPAGGCWFQHNEFEFSATRMSALCQKRTLARLFDHFVGTANQCRWQINAERLRSFQIYKELKVRGQLEWQISRPGTAQDSGDEGSGVFANLALLRPI